MNKEIIFSMVKPYVVNNAITYDEFDKIFSMLSLKEQYVVSNILFENGINLVDIQSEGNNEQLNVEVVCVDEKLENGGIRILYDEGLFRDKNGQEHPYDEVDKLQTIHQLNETLCCLIQQGNRQAEQDICIKNKRLVDKYVKIYEKRYRHLLDFDDLEQVGFIGLLKAAKKFNFKKELSFSTYAVYWIRQCITREIMENGYAIRIPVHMMERINRIATLYNNLDGEVVSLDKKVARIAHELNYSEEVVRECLLLKSNFLTYMSLDMPIGEDGESVLVDFIESDEVSTEQQVMKDVLRDELKTVLATLATKEEDILKLRFGWDDDWNRTLEEVGKKYSVTRERIRQIEAKAIRKMRHRSRSERLKVFLEE